MMDVLIEAAGRVWSSIGWEIVSIWLLWFCVLLAAPWWNWCMTLVVTPAVWRYFSLGVFPIAQCFQLVRLHILQRHTREMYMSKDFSGWTSSGGPVEKAWKIHEELVEKRRVLLVGEGEITTRYLKYIAWACATGRVEQKLLRRAVPVFLRLYPDKETKEEIESRVEDQLNDYGGIEDKSLASSFLRRGGFILILQDIEGKSMSEESRRAVEKFIDGYRNKNFIVVGSSTTIWDGAAAGSPRSAIESLADFPPAIRLESGN